MLKDSLYPEQYLVRSGPSIVFTESMNRLESLHTYMHADMGNSSSKRVPRIYNGEGTVSSTNGVGKTEYVKE